MARSRRFSRLHSVYDTTASGGEVQEMQTGNEVQEERLPVQARRRMCRPDGACKGRSAHVISDMWH